MQKDDDDAGAQRGPPPHTSDAAADSGADFLAEVEESPARSPALLRTPCLTPAATRPRQFTAPPPGLLVDVNKPAAGHTAVAIDADTFGSSAASVYVPLCLGVVGALVCVVGGSLAVQDASLRAGLFVAAAVLLLYVAFVVATEQLTTLRVDHGARTIAIVARRRFAPCWATPVLDALPFADVGEVVRSRERADANNDGCAHANGDASLGRYHNTGGQLCVVTGPRDDVDVAAFAAYRSDEQLLQWRGYFDALRPPRVVTVQVSHQQHGLSL
jgi:hypothetical protein